MTNTKKHKQQLKQLRYHITVKNIFLYGRIN